MDFKKTFKTPICELRWVNLVGQDVSFDKDGSQIKKVATGVIKDSKVADEINARIQAIWAECKDKLGLKKATCDNEVLKPIVDENGDFKGEWELRFKTNVTFPDGTENKIPIYNAKGKEVDIGSKKIGNGSQGIIHGEIAYYDAKAKKGLTLYLKAIQITKFVEYKVGVDAVDVSAEVGDDGFEAFDGDMEPAL